MEDLSQRYQQTLDYLYSFVDYSLTRQDRYSADNFNLDRMKDFMTRLGNPQQAYPVFHIAGTKGKGSTAALIESAARSAGYRTGLYTSPHLIDFTERIQINRQPIQPSALVDLIERLKPVIAEVPGLTTFEITTAAAFCHFAESGVNLAVIEVGLGGRLDATNVLSPLVAVITSLSMDHMNILGSTLAAIAGEKAGIIKHGVPVVSAPQKDEARQVIRRIAAERNSVLTFVDEKYVYTGSDASLEGQNLEIRPVNSGSAAQSIRIPLLGDHQLENAATAYAAIKAADPAVISIPDDAIRRGFASVRWDARFELLSRKPWLLVDCAHNLDSAEKLREALTTYFPGKKILLVFGASEDKDVSGMLEVLTPLTSLVIATRSTHPRAMAQEEIAGIVHRFGKRSQVADTIDSALAEAIKEAREDVLIVVTGSIFVAAAARQLWVENSN